MQTEKLENLMNITTELLSSIEGEDISREGLIDTPKRFSKALTFLTSGYFVDIADVVGDAIFDEPDSEFVLIKDIEFYSLCEHHILQFMGKVHIAYISNGKVIGLSKIPRLVNVFARRLQVQERLTSQIAKELDRILKPKGVAVFIEADHMCMKMRGVQSQHSSTISRSYIGDFKTDISLQREFQNSIRV